MSVRYNEIWEIQQPRAVAVQRAGGRIKETSERLQIFMGQISLVKQTRLYGADTLHSTSTIT